jgi:hypothetical protein
MRQVVRAVRELDVHLTDGAVVHNIEAAPAIDHPCFRPGVQRDCAGTGFFGEIHVSGDIPRRHAQVSAAGDEDMRGIGRRARGIPAENRRGELAQAGKRADPAAELLGEGAERLVGARQAGPAQEQERGERRAREIGGLVQAGGGLDGALGLDPDLVHRLVERQDVKHVAVAVGRTQRLPGSVELPIEDLLACRVARREAQVLGRLPHRRVVRAS